MKTIFFHGETEEGRAFTLAGMQGKTDKHLQMGLALCSEKDGLNKKLGRKISEGRAKSVGTVVKLKESMKGQEGKAFRDVALERFQKKPARTLQTYFIL